ncbi:oligopeptide/dipeptide ABC transporter ATP-binding protein [Embleya sp. MST-111070]
MRAGRAEHPYTRALLAATPRLDDTPSPGDTDGARGLAAISGRPPRPDERPPGCAFAPRCPAVSPICHTTPPPVHAPASGLGVVCHLPGRGSATEEKPPETTR